MNTFALLALSLAGFVHGLSGFGFGLVAMALLPLWMDFKEAVALIAIFNVLVSGVAFAVNRVHFEWRPARMLVLGAGLGVPIGVFALYELEAPTLIRLLGFTMVAYVATEYLFIGEGKHALPEWIAFPLGVVGGVFGGAFNMGGPPIIAYVFSQPWSKQQVVATLQVAFGVSALLRIITMCSVGLLDRTTLNEFAGAAIPVFIAIGAGTLLLQRISTLHLKRGANLFLVTMGLKYLLLTPTAV